MISLSREHRFLEGSKMTSKVVQSAQIFRKEVEKLLFDTKAIFISRIGGSDTNAVVDYIRARELGQEEIKKHIDEFLPHVERFNGFYDSSHDPERKFAQYIDYIVTLESLYRRAKVLTCCNSQILSLFFSDSIHEHQIQKDFRNKETTASFLNEIFEYDHFFRAYPYNFVESVVKHPFTLFWIFSKALSEKRVLAITPFSQSIKLNFKNRHRFFKYDYTYPDFEIETLNTPITYSGIGHGAYPDSNWSATVSRLKSELSSKSFDLALLSCGSYAMPLGAYIEQELGRQAVYVGGVLQLYFGIIGRRYRNIFFEDQINMDAFIEPVERKYFENLIPKDDNFAREAFGAYF
jgi:hypothetical protein